MANNAGAWSVSKGRIFSIVLIVPALLYLKMRQLSGEPLSASLAQIEDDEGERSKWQQRMRTRLSLHIRSVRRRRPTVSEDPL